MRHAGIDHVDSREDDDDDRDCPAEAPRGLPRFLRHVSPLPVAREGADGSRAHSVYALAEPLTKARGGYRLVPSVWSRAVGTQSLGDLLDSLGLRRTHGLP